MPGLTRHREEGSRLPRARTRPFPIYMLFMTAMFGGLPVSAQWSDTTRTDDVQDKAKFIVNLDARQQAVAGDVVKFFGLRFGIQKKRNIYALGFYGLGSPFEDRSIILEDFGKDSIDIRTSLGYLSGTYERILLDTRKWQLSVPFMAGLGRSPLDRKDSTGVYVRFKDYPVYPLETGVRASYKLLFWLYVQGGLGYRQVLGPKEFVDRRYSGATWNFGLSIKFGKIFRYAKDKLEERRERKAMEDGTP